MKTLDSLIFASAEPSWKDTLDYQDDDVSIIDYGLVKLAKLNNNSIDGVRNFNKENKSSFVQKPVKSSVLVDVLNRNTAYLLPVKVKAKVLTNVSTEISSKKPSVVASQIVSKLPLKASPNTTLNKLSDVSLNLSQNIPQNLVQDIPQDTPQNLASEIPATILPLKINSTTNILNNSTVSLENLEIFKASKNPANLKETTPKQESLNNPFKASRFSLEEKLMLTKKNILKDKKNSLIKIAATSILSILILFTAINFNSIKTLQPFGQVAGVSEGSTKNLEADNYSKWIKSYNQGSFSNAEEDLDKDGLTNNEEQLLGTNPVNANTCSKEKTDGQLLSELVNPKTCLPIDKQSEEEFQQFSKFLNLDKAKLNLEQKNSGVAPIAVTSTNSSILSVFGISSYDSLSSITKDKIEEEAKLTSTKIEYIKTIEKIENYINEYRSYDIYDRDYASPVHPAKYLDVSIKYNTPLKYVLALARNESRFGTDRFTNSGNPTRPNTYKNIYSIGLTGSSSSGYNTWEDGVEAFGKWYKSFHDRGVSDCRKWRIYNPNGDYCTKIEEMASQIQAYLDK